MWQHGLVTLQNCEESVMVIAILQSTIILASVFDKCECEYLVCFQQQHQLVNKVNNNLVSIQWASLLESRCSSSLYLK